MTKVTNANDGLYFLIVGRGYPEPVREYRFAPPRKWRLDFAWPDRMLALEYEGGIYVAGRHVRPEGFAKDVEKYNTATLLGWRLLRCSINTMGEDQIWAWLSEAMEAFPPKQGAAHAYSATRPAAPHPRRSGRARKRL